jgi:Ca-activated chloride channel family protein
MVFLWPGFLFLLVLIPLLTGLYIWISRRRRLAVRYSSLELVRAALPHKSHWRIYIPVILFLLGLTSLVFALGRPVAILSVPTNQTTIILTMDVSGSMRSRDIPPSRLQAAEQAAFNFIQHQNAHTQIGLVAFSRFAEIIQPPTTKQESLQVALDSLSVGRRTAIGSGILAALDAISQVDKNVLHSITETQPGVEPTPVPKGDYAPDIIVLLTDGASNAGPDPLDAAQQAANRGVRVYTIGFGTVNGPSPSQSPFGGSGFFGGGGGFGGGGFRLGLNEPVLKQIASLTGGTYHLASSASELESVFASLPTYLIIKHEVLEITFAFTTLGALLVATAILLSLIWHPLP